MVRTWTTYVSDNWVKVTRVSTPGSFETREGESYRTRRVSRGVINNFAPSETFPSVASCKRNEKLEFN